ncbi:hypothetical protein VTU32_06485 [Thermoanaerobacter sp. CM-CNRG TB177]|jgi:uncharacterized membrane protein YgcG|uniref:sunset domain-containing protein n=1 Tax=Thermoanaerobacter sp. CM-CNRG TB177 TaxID=2800659 RepID=UPI001BDF4995|nr:hypothetical protein [Thermoanaerobacter sp. CM-CNRG TB177]MBT1278944.1 hypothetical protein [Thermoanaerobacter sp. CM-CNRG TB177]
MKENLLQQILTNRRKIFVLIFLFVLLFPTFVYADTFIERVLAWPIDGLVNGIRTLGFKTIDELVFNLPNTETAPFTKDEWDIAMKWYNTIEIATGGLAVIAMIINGFRLMSAGSNPSKRADAMQKMWLVVLAYAIIWFLPTYSKLIFMANAYLTEVFKNLMQVYAGGKFIQGGWNFIDAIQTNNILTTALVKLAFVGLMVYFNFLYTIRKFVLIAMLVVVPIVVWSWSITGYSRGIGLVAGEIVSNAFMQSSHALVLSLYAVLVSPGVSSDFSDWWAQLFGLIALIPTSKVLREVFMGFLKFLGVNEEFYAGLAMAGFSGLAAIAGLAGRGWNRSRGTVTQRVLDWKKDRKQDTGGSTGDSSGGGGNGGSGPYGGEEVESEPLFTKEKYDSYTPSSEGVPGLYASTAPYPSEPVLAGNETGFNSIRRQTPPLPPGRDKPGERYQKALGTAEKARNVLGGALGTVGAVAGGAMGLALGESAMKDLGTIGAGIGRAVGAAGGSFLGTVGGLGYQTASYKYATDDPTRLYVDEKGNGLIKGVKLEDGSMKYYMPDDEGYADIQPTATFRTEIEAQEHGYTPYKKADLGDKIKNITGTEHAFDGTGKIIGTTILSPFGTKASEIGEKAGEIVARGMRTGIQKGYEWIKNVSEDPDKFRWK